MLEVHRLLADPSAVQATDCGKRQPERQTRTRALRWEEFEADPTRISSPFNETRTLHCHRRDLDRTVNGEEQETSMKVSSHQQFTTSDCSSQYFQRLEGLSQVEELIIKES